jgi:hypothetical protein
MLYLDEAILNRWNAKNLTTSIPGGVWHGSVPEAVILNLANDVPYCIWTDVSDSTSMRSSNSRYQTSLVQFQVIALQDVQCGQLCELVEQAFLNANQAASNPLTMAGVGPGQDSVLSCQLMSPYVIEDVGDTVNQGTMTFSIEYGRLAGLRPA